MYLKYGHLEFITYVTLPIHDEINIHPDDTRHALKLRGIIYIGQYHFTCRVFDENGAIWHNDGITTGRTSSFEGYLQDLDDTNDLLYMYKYQRSDKKGCNCDICITTLRLVLPCAAMAHTPSHIRPIFHSARCYFNNGHFRECSLPISKY